MLELYPCILGKVYLLLIQTFWILSGFFIRINNFITTSILSLNSSSPSLKLPVEYSIISRNNSFVRLRYVAISNRYYLLLYFSNSWKFCFYFIDLLIIPLFKCIYLVLLSQNLYWSLAIASSKQIISSNLQSTSITLRSISGQLALYIRRL